MIGGRCIKALSKTQAVLAKSSAESELYSVVKGAAEGLGLLTLNKDLGEKKEVRLNLDATAAKRILERQGISKVRLIDVNVLWLEQQLAKKIIPLVKVAGTENCSDFCSLTTSRPPSSRTMLPTFASSSRRAGRQRRPSFMRWIASNPRGSSGTRASSTNGMSEENKGNGLGASYSPSSDVHPVSSPSRTRSEDAPPERPTNHWHRREGFTSPTSWTIGPTRPTLIEHFWPDGPG